MKTHWISYTLILAIAATGGYVLYRQLSSDDTQQPAADTASVTTTTESGTGAGAAPAPQPTDQQQPQPTGPAAPTDTQSAADESALPTPPSLPDDDEGLNKLGAEEKLPEFKLPNVKGRTGDHALADSLLRLASRKDKQDVLAQYVQQGLLSQQQADALLTFYRSVDANYEPQQLKLIPVGTHIHGERNVSRYKLESDSGEQLYLDMLAPVTPSDPSQAWSILAVNRGEKGKLEGDTPELSIHTVEQFIRAVSSGNMLAARQLVTGKGVSDATVAGLCMVFAEGGYRLRERAPIRASFENLDRAGYLVYLKGSQGPLTVYVGIELAQQQDKSWKIDGVSLDSLLTNYEESAGAEGGRFFPIVKIPQGGDSLVLFFAFDDSQLTPRSLRQLQIVADLLKESQRKLDISGHTDDVGSERYNKELSLKRASAVMKALIDFGVSPGQITMKGLGKSQPRRNYSTERLDEQQIEAIRSENRRAEIYLDFQ